MRFLKTKRRKPSFGTELEPILNGSGQLDSIKYEDLEGAIVKQLKCSINKVRALSSSFFLIIGVN